MAKRTTKRRAGRAAASDTPGGGSTPSVSDINPGRMPDGSLRLSPFGGYTVEFERQFDAKIEDVWRALTDPARLVDWYADTKIEPQLGGKFEQRFANSGATANSLIVEFDPPRVFAHMWVTGKTGSPTQPIPAKLAEGNGTCGDLTLAASVIRYELSGGTKTTKVKLSHYVPLNPALIPSSLSKDVSRAAAPQTGSRVSKTPAPDMVLATWDIALDLLGRALASPGVKTMSLTRGKREDPQTAWPWQEFEDRRKAYTNLGRNAIVGTLGGRFFEFE
jgi:uncharacterized protein YndB with AHSA1/START domain